MSVALLQIGWLSAVVGEASQRTSTTEKNYFIFKSDFLLRLAPYSINLRVGDNVGADNLKMK